MTKKDLKPWMMVRLRNQENFIVVDYCGDLALFRPACCLYSICTFTDDLKSTTPSASASSYDIMEVWSETQHAYDLFNNTSANRVLLWEREEKKRMTKAEIEKELGYEIEIVEG